jgi:plasmid stabilization system protein ParE
LISVEFRDAATTSLLDQADYFVSAGNTALAERWNAAIDKTILDLKRFPQMGSPCFFRHPDLSDLRSMLITGFPRYLLFYRFVEAANLILVVDVLHGARDIEPLLTPPKE